MTHYEIIPAKKFYGKHSIHHVLLRNGQVEYHGDKKSAEETLRKLARLVWDCLGDVPVNNDGHLQTPFEAMGTVYPAGTDREDVWHDIEECFGVPVYDIVFGEKA